MSVDAPANTYFNLFGNQATTPDANTLLSLKLLADTNKNAFQLLAGESTKFLASSLALIRADPYLKVKLGGNLLQSSMMLADILKNYVEKKHFEERIDGVAHQLLKHEYAVGLGGKLPKKGNNAVLQFNAGLAAPKDQQLKIVNAAGGNALFFI